jgi:hypothetical protein
VHHPLHYQIPALSDSALVIFFAGAVCVMSRDQKKEATKGCSQDIQNNFSQLKAFALGSAGLPWWHRDQLPLPWLAPCPDALAMMTEFREGHHKHGNAGHMTAAS